MPKKSFKDINPALQFISNATTESETENATQPIRADYHIPKGYKDNPKYIEKKDRRLQLLLQPSLYQAIKERADAEGVSVNEYCHRALEKATKGLT